MGLLPTELSSYYRGDVNDALVKVQLEMVQFTKKLVKLDELVEHDLATMETAAST